MSGQRIKVPVLMYHEVWDESGNGDAALRMTPFYCLSPARFEAHVQALADRGFRSLLFDEVRDLDPDGRYVIITFDDGLKGNVEFALPILKRYGFRAVIFTVVGRVGSPRYLNWDDLQTLTQHGMSVQSHTLTHRPLQTLSEADISSELRESKRTLEDRLQGRVTALSFPHGSYDRRVIAIAEHEGYSVLCTSEVRRTYAETFLTSPALLGRFTVTSALDATALGRCVTYEPLEMWSLMARKRAKNMVKRVIGIERYRAIYRRLFHIKTG